MTENDMPTANSWKTTDAAELATASEAVLGSDCTYTDPNVHAKGMGDIVDCIMAFQQRMPGGHFVTTSFVDHHDRALASWNMVAGDGTVVGTGHSFSAYDENGMLSSATGFFDAPQTSDVENP